MKTRFKNNLLNIIQDNGYNLTKYVPYFSVHLIVENNVKYNSVDDTVRLWLLSEKNIINRSFSLEEVIDFLCISNRFCPLWIEICFVKIENNIVFFTLNISMRFRKFSQLKHKENDYAPFIFNHKIYTKAPQLVQARALPMMQTEQQILTEVSADNCPKLR